MTKLWIHTGRILFWLTWPALYTRLRVGSRTRVLLVHGNEFLAVKGWIGTGQWQLPGGGVHAGEVPIDGAIRETKEETDITLTEDQLKLLGQNQARHHGLNFHYTAYTVRLIKKPAISRQKWELTHLDWLPLQDIARRTDISPETVDIIKLWSKKA